MISKNLFFKLQKEDLKRRLWTLALIIIVMLLILPIRCAMYAENDYVNTLDNLIDFMGPANPLMAVFTVISAILSGLSGFFYLQSRKKVDLYHSIPVKREMLFSVGYLNGILVYAIPYLFNILVCFIVLWLKNFMCSEILSSALIAFGIHMLYYCLIYTVTIIAVMMTGNIIISFMGSMVFLFYGPMWIGIWDGYSSQFFRTYYSMIDNEAAYAQSSPIVSFVSVIRKYTSDSDYRYLILISAIELAVLIALAVFLYRKRPSEAAGNAMAFNLSKPIIKFLLVIPIGLGGGLVLRNVVSGNQDGWLLFGVIFTLVIVYGFIQVIYNFDIRSAFTQIKQLFACVIITGLIVCIFRFDVLQFDTYIPKMNSVKSMSVYIEGIDQNIGAYNPNQQMHGYVGIDEYQLKYMKLTDYSAAYSLAQVGIEERNNISYKNRYSNDIMSDYYNYIVKYTLQNNKTVYRRYRIAKSMSKDLLEKIYNNEEFKKTHYTINQMQAENIDNMRVSYVSDVLNYEQNDAHGNGNLYFDNKAGLNDIKQLLQIYRDELNHLTFKEASEGYPVAALDITINNINYSNYYIYPSFTKTLEFLKERGFDAEKTVNLNNISEIVVMKNANKIYEYDSYKYSESIQAPIADEQKVVTYNDPEKIKEIFPALVSSNVYQNTSTISKIDGGIEAIINYKSSAEKFSYNFIPGKMPGFVKHDLGITEE